MKYLTLIMILVIAFILECYSQSDTLVINLKNNQIEKIEISKIQKIQFENITAVENQVLHTINLAIKGNFPNPFAELTNIEFEIGTPGIVEMVIYNNSGEQIQTLKCENCQAGKDTLLWNCRDKNNIRVQSGAYYYEVRFNNEIQSRKMILVK
jgi:hypothetical protein